MAISQQDLQLYFAAVDEDKSGLIDAQELQVALAKGGVVLSLAATAQLIRLHDRGNDGKIDFHEFAALNKFLADAHVLFSSIAGPAPGAVLTRDQLWTALQQSGFFLEQPAFLAVCTAFDPERTATYDLTRFYALLAFLKSAFATFKGFDAAGQGIVAMNLNQFVYAAANTR